MIAVVFEPRFGSSKVMQALADAGHPVCGDKFPSWISEENKQWNPLGFYEHPNPAKAIADGIGRAAIKLRIKEAMEILLPKDTRFVFCVRDVFFATRSQIRSGLVPWSSEEEGLKTNSRSLDDLDTAAPLWKHMERHGLADAPSHLLVDHEQWIANPEAEKASLLEWANGV